MTLRELLAQTPFDSIVPYIILSGQPDDVCHYKQAYDILLHTAPCEAGCHDVQVGIYREEDGTEYVDASQIEGCWGNEYIDGNVITEEGIEVSQEELAFRLLWHLTFFGYSPEQSDETLHTMGDDGYHDNEYGRMARYIDNKRYLLWANKAIRKRIFASIEEYKDEGRHCFALSEEDWSYIQHHERHCNRMKRMRDHRLELRLKELENLDRCENTIRQLLRGQISHITRDDLHFLWNKGGRTGNDFQTRAYDATCRLAYLDELVSKYGALDAGKTMRKCVVRLSTSQDYPLTQEEKGFIYNMVKDSTMDNNPTLIEAINETLGYELGVMIVGIE